MSGITVRNETGELLTLCQDTLEPQLVTLLAK